MISFTSNADPVLTELSSKLQQLQTGGTVYNSMLQSIGATMLYDIKSRIHQQGLAADGSRVGEYSRKPIYVPISKSGGAPVGKTGKAVFKTGKRKGQLHASRYYPGGYAQYRATIGATEPLVLTGALKNGFSLLTTTAGFTLGWADSKLSARAAALERKYGKPIWAFGSTERSKALLIAKNFVSSAFY
jgi:hypothetical protein